MKLALTGVEPLLWQAGRCSPRNEGLSAYKWVSGVLRHSTMYTMYALLETWPFIGIILTNQNEGARTFACLTNIV